MAPGHHHHHEHHRHGPVAAEPTLSLLRLSAGQRLGGAAGALALLWVLVALVLGWY